MVSPYLIMPFGAAIIYAVASVLLKRALKEGAKSDQTFHFTNFAISLVFLPFFFFEKELNFREIKCDFVGYGAKNVLPFVQSGGHAT